MKLAPPVSFVCGRCRREVFEPPSPQKCFALEVQVVGNVLLKVPTPRVCRSCESRGRIADFPSLELRPVYP